MARIQSTALTVSACVALLTTGSAADHHRPGEEPPGREDPRGAPGTPERRAPGLPAPSPPGPSRPSAPPSTPEPSRAQAAKPTLSSAAPSRAVLEAGARDEISVRLTGSGLVGLGPAEVRSGGVKARGLAARITRIQASGAVLELSLSGDARPGRYQVFLLGGDQPLLVPLELSVSATPAPTLGRRTPERAPERTNGRADESAKESKQTAADDSPGKPPGGRPLVPSPSAYTPGAVLVIRVEDDDSGAPIAGAYVCLGEPGGNPVKYGRYQTNDQGETPPWSTVPQDTPLLATVEAEGYEGDSDEVDLDPDDDELLDVDTVDLDPGSGGPTCQPLQFEIPEPLEGEVEQGPPLEAPDETYDATPPDEPGEDPGVSKPDLGQDNEWEVAVPQTPTAQGPDLVLSVAQSPLGTIQAGQSVSYAVAIENLGGVDAEDVAFSAHIPTALDYTSHSVLPGFQCAYTGATSKLDCSDGELPAGFQKSLTILAAVPDPLEAELVTFSVVADAAGEIGELDESNNSASVQTALAPGPEVTIVFATHELLDEQAGPEAEAHGFGLYGVEDGCKVHDSNGRMTLPTWVAGGCTQCTFRMYQGRSLNPPWEVVDLKLFHAAGKDVTYQVVDPPDGGDASFEVQAEQCNPAGAVYPVDLVHELHIRGPEGQPWQAAFE